MPRYRRITRRPSRNRRRWIQSKTAGGPTAYTMSMGGSLTPAGGLVKAVSRFWGGTFTPVGALAKLADKRFGGTLTTSGALTNASIRLFLLAVGGTLTTSGSIVKTVNKGLGGVLTPTGFLSRVSTATVTTAIKFFRRGKPSATTYKPPSPGEPF